MYKDTYQLDCIVNVITTEQKIISIYRVKNF